MSLTRASKAAIAAVGGIAASVVLTTGTAAAVESPSLHRDATNKLVYAGADTAEHLVLDRDAAGKLVVQISSASSVQAGPGCVLVMAVKTVKRFHCGGQTPVTRVDLAMAGGRDRVEWRVPVTGAVRGGDETDTFLPNPGFHRGDIESSVVMHGDGADNIVDYRLSNAPVRVSLDGNANDGRLIDRDSVRGDIRHIHGSPFNDRLEGTYGHDVFTPAGGADEVITNGMMDSVHTVDGAIDTIRCGGGSILASTDGFDVLDNCRQAG
ncbi:hypothetical protein ACTG9Q_15450 [Actinokineospora sp. 24-640]